LNLHDHDELDRLYALFKEQAEAISALVYRVTDPSAAGKKLREIINQLAVNKLVAVPSPLVNSCLNNAGAQTAAVHTTNLRNYAPEADLGLSEVDLAVAETGTLVQDSTAPEQRLVSTLPPVHVALVQTGRLVHYLSDAIDLFNTNKDTSSLPGYISFISGPSRTADIERVLTIGVHGPEKLYVIFVDRAGGACVE